MNRKALFFLVAVLEVAAPAARAAKNGGIPVLLPPFVAVPAPQPFLQAVSPFDVTGFIESASLDATCTAHPFCGGTVVVNGIAITVPANTILQMPAASMTWEELFTNAPAAWRTNGQTGLALSDLPKPLTSFEAHIQGNRVINGSSDRYIAGLVYISQQAANNGQGYVNFIDYAKAEIWVSQKLGGPAGARIRINTPRGRFGKPDPNADVRFTADEDNPTITSSTGYPMCVPRFDPAAGNDSLCPQWNRPRDSFTGAFSTIFTMSPAAPGPADSAGVVHQAGYPSPAVTPDPFEQAPFEIGDFVTYAGTLTADPNGGLYISAHTITADLGIFTAPGTWPVYARMGEFRIGVGGTPNPLFPQEAVEKVFGDFFTTDSTALVDVYAVDVNPCTGQRTHRFYGTADPFGPPVGGVKGRARLRATIGNFLPPTREMAIASRSLTGGGPLDTATIQLTANGVAAGTFQAPQFEFIFPENLVFGSPQVPLTFQEFPFLVNGFGPYVPFNAGSGAAPAGTVGQLDPWPGFNAPPASCTTGMALLQPPVANAGSPQTVPSGATVTLDGSASYDTNSPPLSLIYTWQQSSGPAVNLLNANAAKPQFTAPVLNAGQTAVVLTFQLAVCNGFTCGGVSSVNITVAPPAGAPSVTLSATPGQNVVPGSPVTLTATATGGTAPLSYTFAQTQGPVQTLTRNGASASFTVTLPAGTVTPATLTFSVTVTDAAGRSSTATISIFAGNDTIAATSVVYSMSKSKLQVTATTNALPRGAAVLTVTPLGGAGTAIGPDVVMTYDPTANTYNILSVTVNPTPAAVRIRSSFGGVVVAPVTKIR